VIASNDPVGAMLEQATRTLSTAGQRASDATAHAQQILHQLQAVREQVDHYAGFVLLPLCLALLILAEHHRAMTDGSAFRVGNVLARTAAVVVGVLAYSQLCGLICRVAGAGSGWMTSNNYLDLYNVGTDSLGTAWDKVGGLSDMPKLIGMVIVWIILMMSVLFAYVAGALLSVIQACSLAIFLGLGKACIVVSLVPGVNLAKSWARALAQVAAWSTVAAVINGLLAAKNVAIGQLIASGQFVELLKVSAHFVILALTTLSVPIITSKLFSGGAAGLTEVLPGFLAARGAASAVSNRLSALRRGGVPGSPSGAGQPPGAPRVHKVPFDRAARPSAEAERVRPMQPRLHAKRLPLHGMTSARPRSTASAEAPPAASVVAPSGRAAQPPAQPRRRANDTLLDHVIDVTGETA
jgi:hypothetical protein